LHLSDLKTYYSNNFPLSSKAGNSTEDERGARNVQLIGEEDKFHPKFTPENHRE
jgi:hypothetical protein